MHLTDSYNLVSGLRLTCDVREMKPDRKDSEITEQNSEYHLKTFTVLPQNTKPSSCIRYIVP
jgi:hypothetical protein